MKKNPITTIIGLLIMLCPIVGEFFPEAKEVCDRLILELAGLGFIASADGIKRNPVSAGPTASSWMLPLALVGLLSISACAQLNQLQRSVIETLDSVTETIENAVESVKDTAKDAVMLDCQTNEDPAVTGCL